MQDNQANQIMVHLQGIKKAVEQQAADTKRIADAIEKFVKASVD